MGKKLFTIALCLFISIGAAWAQTIRVSGTVTDVTNGEPVVGAAVQLKGSASTYALTDVSGKYTLSVPADAILTVSSLGFNPTEVQVNGRGVVDIGLTPEAQLLDDVLVVAYGTAKKESFTGSAGTVKSESLQKRTVANVSKALEGMVAGISTTSGSGQPGEGASIQIRGTGSINASSNPLYVVDGIPFDGNLSSINPNDIESLTVLKDASAAALYGARAANGVIMITTKRGSEGHSVVNLKATVGLQSRSIRDYDTVNQEEFVELTWEALKNNYVINGGYDLAKAKLLRPRVFPEHSVESSTILSRITSGLTSSILRQEGFAPTRFPPGTTTGWMSSRKTRLSARSISLVSAVERIRQSMRSLSVILTTRVSSSQPSSSVIPSAPTLTTRLTTG